MTTEDPDHSHSKVMTIMRVIGGVRSTLSSSETASSASASSPSSSQYWSSSSSEATRITDSRRQSLIKVNTFIPGSHKLYPSHHFCLFIFTYHLLFEKCFLSFKVYSSGVGGGGGRQSNKVTSGDGKSQASQKSTKSKFRASLKSTVVRVGGETRLGEGGSNEFGDISIVWSYVSMFFIYENYSYKYIHKPYSTVEFYRI